MNTGDPLSDGSPGPDDARWLHPELVDAVARRVLELVREPAMGNGSARSGLLTVAEVAERLRVSPKWVYAHQRRLRAIKLGEGPKARLRFHAATFAEFEHAEREPAIRQDAGTPQPPANVKRTRRRLRSRPLPPIDRAPGRA